MGSEKKMTKKQFVSELQIKDLVDSTFLVKHIAVMEGRDGRPYVNIVLSDNSGDIEGRIWGNASVIGEKILRGQLVWIKGKINQYQGRKQLIVQDICLVENTEKYNEEDYITKSSHSAEVMYSRILEVVEVLDDVYIKSLLKAILSDLEISRRLLIWQAGKTIHHAYQSGLLEHIHSCVELSLLLGKHYNANINYLVAGSVLHDICKVYELTNGPLVDYTEEGKLLGHIIKSLELVDKFAYKIKNFPYNTKLHLKHILLTHHGEYAFGSPKLPHTREAYLLHLIDLMDSKINSIDQIIKSDNTVGHWSQYIKHMDRMIYKSPLPKYTEFIEPAEHSGDSGNHAENGEYERHDECDESSSPPVAVNTASTARVANSSNNNPYKKKGNYAKEGPRELKTSMEDLLKGFKVD